MLLVVVADDEVEDDTLAPHIQLETDEKVVDDLLLCLMTADDVIDLQMLLDEIIAVQLVTQNIIYLHLTEHLLL